MNRGTDIAQLAQRGRLKIFLGYAAGVGKTYAMLEAAQQRREQGVDVLIGLLNSRERIDIAEKIVGIDSLPDTAEFNLDAILARHPSLVVVDELSYTNPLGTRHPKRYQDVQELLNAGIDVYTTLNIQNIESLRDVVERITGTRIVETIPDRVIDEANELELIDLPPDELLQRIEAGKISFSGETTRKFFRKGNLTALREMAMRRAAEHVDDQMRAYMQDSSIRGPWPATERILVCVSYNEFGERLVRSTRRLADELSAEWFAIHVEPPNHAVLPASRREQMIANLRLAEELGAHTKITPSGNSITSIAETIIAYARKHNITKIVVGRPIHPRWFDLVRGSLVNELIYQSGDIDIHVVTSNQPEHIPVEEIPLRLHSRFSAYLSSIVLTVLATVVGHFLGREISPTNLVMLYLLTVVMVAVFFGRGPSMLASLLGVLAFDFFFVPPFYTFAVNDTEYVLTFIGLFIVGVVVSALTVSAREQAQAAQRREADTALLYSLSRELAATDSLEAILKAVQGHLEADFGRDIVFYIFQAGSMRAVTAPDALYLQPGDLEMGLVNWVFQHAEPAGAGTQTQPSAEPYFIPLKTSKQTVGVLSLKPHDLSRFFDPDKTRILEAIANQAAQAVDRVLLAEQSRQMKLLQATEKLQNALLNSISHDLRTPLVSITGALTSLETQSDNLTENARRSLVETAREEAERLNRLVGNLLDMTRLESGALNVKRELADMQDLLGASIGQMESRLTGRKLQVDVPENIPLVAIDFVLIVHVLNNLLDNALKYSPENSPLMINARHVEDEVQICVQDEGIGIPPDELERVFDKFYRVQRSSQAAGTGLGLAICRGIVEAHGGRIWAENYPSGGTAIYFSLPL
ncbi:MAG: sensor histidine kinase KdpD [Anaerolineae bacterium]|nr:sensor histidine kinase KdpD [Anaerolineae bacterium]